MKYPDHPTETKPVTGERAKQLLAIIDAGGSITNDRAKATMQRILERQRKGQSGNGEPQEEEVRGN